MDPISALIGGGASLLGNIFSSQTSAANTQANIMAQQGAQAETERFNMQEAAKTRDFQQQQILNQEDFQQNMSNSAYQRSVADMKKAGLNPMMMFGSGGPASVPTGGAAGGATASVGTPNMAVNARTSPFANLGDVVSKAVSTSGDVTRLDKLHEETRQQKAEADKSEAIAQQEKLKLPQSELESLEANERMRLPKEDIVTHATSGYKYGDHWYNNPMQPLEAGANVLNRTVQKIVDGVTGPSGKAMWDKVRNTSWPSFSNPNIRGTTLNPDFGSQYNTP